MKEIIEWIDASERLPEKPGLYLCWDSHLKEHDLCFFDPRRPLNKWDFDISRIDGRDFEVEIAKPTHWAELPKGPTPIPEPIPYETNS